MTWAILRRILRRAAADDGHGVRPVAGIPPERKAEQEAETREYLERARVAEALARIQAKERP